MRVLRTALLDVVLPFLAVCLLLGFVELFLRADYNKFWIAVAEALVTLEIGVLAEGAKADLIVVRGNPLKDIGLLENDGQHIPLVMRDGQIFKDEPLVA